MKRGLPGQKTNPSALAPASTAAFASSRRVMPQIFTSIGVSLTLMEHKGHTGHKGTSVSCRSRRPQNRLCVYCVLCVPAALEQLPKLLPRIRRRHEPLADEKRAVAEAAQPREIVRGLQATLAHCHDLAWNPRDHLL